MRVFAERTARSLMVTAFGAAALSGLTLAPAALAQTAGTMTLAPTPGSVQSAGSMLDAGRLIEARDTLQRLLSNMALPSAERTQASQMLERINDRILATDPIEIALQKAELAIRQGDLKTAERQATGVAGSQAPAALQERAQFVLKQVSTRRAQLEPMTAQMLAQVEKDFNAGEYAKAKQGLQTIAGSGVTLSDADQRYVDAFRMRIVDLERARGSSFESDRINLAVAPKTGADSALEAEQPSDNPQLPPKMPDPYFPPDPKTKPAPTPPPAAPAPEPVAPAPAPKPAPIAPAPKPAPEPMPEPAPMPKARMVEPLPPVVTPPPKAAPAPAQPSADSLMRMALLAEAQRTVYEGDAAFAEGRYAEAARKYESALGGQKQYLSSEDIAHAQMKLDEAKVRMAGPGSGALVDNVLQNSRINREKATAEFENNLTEAKKASDAANGTRALENVNRAKFIVDQNRAYFSQTEYDAMIARADAARADVMAKDEITKLREREKAEIDARTKNNLSQQRVRAEKAQKIHESIDRIRTLQREQRYGEALDVCNQVLFIDPQNPTADLLKKILEDLLVYRERDAAVRNKTIGMQRQRLDNLEASAPPLGLVNYPLDWPSMTARRTGAGGYFESDENRRAISALGKEIPVKFENVPFARALAYIGQATNVSVDTDWKSLEAIGVDQNTPVTLELNNTAANVVLERILSKVSTDRFNKASSAVRDGILTIGSADAIHRQTVTLTYPITDMLLFAPDYTDVPDMNLEHKTGPLAEARLLRGDPFKFERSTPIPEKRERIRQLVSVIQHSVDPDNWKENGGDIGSVVELNGVLVITNTPENHREITGLLSKLREVRQTQINVEARFLLVDQNFFEQINFDIDLYFNGNSNQVTTARLNDPNIVPSNFFNALGQPVTSLDSNVYATGGSVTPVLIPPGAVNRSVQNIVPPHSFSPIAVPSNGNLSNSLVPANNSFVTGLLNQAPALGIAGRYLDDIQVDFMIKATQADLRTVSLTAPRLTFTNGQIANVVVGTQTAYVSDLTPITGDGSVGFDPVPGTLVEGVTLLVEAVASADRRYVTMNIETTVAQLIKMVPFTEQAVAAGGGTGGAAAVPVTGTFQLPTISASSVHTTVTVPDQGTILLGGQRLTTEVEIETGVPILSKIPIINRFFTNRIQSRQDQSLLMLVKPTILIQSEEEEKAFPGLNDSLRGGQ